MGNHFVAFLSISVFIIVLPGPDTAVVTRNALLGGRRGGIFSAFGVATGLATWTVATSAGVAALLLASEPAFLAVKLAGATYLLFLGAQTLLAALRGGEATSAATSGRSVRRVSRRIAYRQGLISDLGNPKIAVFFTSLLPQFTSHGSASFGALLLLGLIFCAITLVWLVGYATAAAKAGDVLRRPRVQRSIEGFTGTVLVGFGLRLATEHR
ncbi:MAG: LysE family translocator [Dehalococcoidia bacterium]